MVYQEVPQPSHPTTDTTAKSAEEYGYGDAITYATSGHLRVTVSAYGPAVAASVSSAGPDDAPIGRRTTCRTRSGPEPP